MDFMLEIHSHFSKFFVQKHENFGCLVKFFLNEMLNA